MAESPPPVSVTTVGLKTDFAEAAPRSARPTAPPQTPQVVETEPPPELGEEPTGEHPDQ